MGCVVSLPGERCSQQSVVVVSLRLWHRVRCHAYASARREQFKLWVEAFRFVIDGELVSKPSTTTWALDLRELRLIESTTMVTTNLPTVVGQPIKNRPPTSVYDGMRGFCEVFLPEEGRCEKICLASTVTLRVWPPHEVDVDADASSRTDEESCARGGREGRAQRGRVAPSSSRRCRWSRRSRQEERVEVDEWAVRYRQ
jgi:hypothetical protein